MNKTISRYLDKNILFPKCIEEVPEKDLGIIIVIPCYDESDVVGSVQSIMNCRPPGGKVEIIVSINAGGSSPVNAKNQNLDSYEKLLSLRSKMPPWVKLFPIIHNDLPDKKAGVGLGRKIGMDEAVIRFSNLENEHGLIVCFDADSKCDVNYLCAIETHFDKEQVSSASIYFEHPIKGNLFSQDIYNSIVQYELHLRYFINMQKRLGLPFAYHTVGSSMACTVLAYCAVGGMNQRKAGEDFYFVHKLIKYGHHSALNSTRVIPSPRISNRVPFGTGRAIALMQMSEEPVYYTYHPQSFIELKDMVDGLQKVYQNKKIENIFAQGLNQFLASVNADREVVRIFKNTSDYSSFCKMFWHWFDAFILMKYLHFVRDSYYPDIPVLQAVNWIGPNDFKTDKDALIYYRELELIS